MTSISGLLSAHLTGILSVAFTALVAPIVVDIVKRRIADGSLYQVKATRASALTGVWIGRALDSGSTPEETFDFKVRLSLTYSKPRILGQGELLMLEDDERVDLDFEGSFHNENFVQLSYRNRAIGCVQLGVALFRLSDVGTELEGIYAGYSPLRGQLVSGTLTLTKRNS